MRRDRHVRAKQIGPGDGVAQFDTAPSAAPSVPDDVPATLRPDHIPEHVWHLLQQAGEVAAQRLHDLLSKPSFARLRPSEQIKLVDLALTRAYGQPIKREVRIDLSGGDADAVAASLARITGRLPEYRDITPDPAPITTAPETSARRRRKGAKLP